MLPGQVKLFAILVILFDAQQRIYCDVLAIDTCTKYIAQGGSISRAVIPMEAGREGIDLRKGWIHIKNSVAKGSMKNSTWSLKFYVKFGQPKSGEFVAIADDEMKMYHLGNDSFQLYCEFYKGDSFYARGRIALDGPREMIGIKMKIVSKRNKREATSNNSNWTMIGIEYSKYPNKEGYMKVYINGKLKGDIHLKTDEYIEADDFMSISKGVYSCIQQNVEPMGIDYYEDFNLNECKQHYKDEPEQKFLECEK